MPDIHIQAGVSVPVSSVSFRSSRSSGPGGQNVNKLETKVELLVPIDAIVGLTDEERRRVRSGLGRVVDADGVIHIISQRHRSQWKNREEAIRIFGDRLRFALRVRKKRVATRAGSGAKERRLKGKKVRGGHKRMRGRVRESGDE